MSSGSISFGLLGPLRVVRGGDEPDLGPRQQRLVLAFLLARAGDLVTMTELLELLWPDDPSPRGTNTVHKQIGALRRLFEPDLASRSDGTYLQRRPAGYRLLVSEENFDLPAFRQAAAQGRAALAAGDAGEALSRSRAALGLWRGRVAADLEPVSLDHPVFVAIEAERVRAIRVAADAAAATGDTEAVLLPLQQAADRYPLDEALQSRLLIVLAVNGRQAEALERFELTRKRLADELGVDPGADLREAYDRLLHQQVQPASSVPVPAKETATRPAQLPPDLVFFSGREEALADARTIAEQHGGGGVIAVDGMPGVGKTTFSVHLAHLLAGCYPDGQLYVDLRGFDDRGPAMTTAEALRGFLGALGVSQDRVPTDLHAQTGMFRSTVAGRRLLIVLDNCRDFDQIRHLLPGAPGCLAIANSRNRLTGLLTSVGAHLIRLAPPSPGEARAELRRRLRERVDHEPEAADEIIAACGRLPLALAVVAARALTQPHLPLAGIAAEIAPAPQLLDGFGADEPQLDLRAVFSWSYRTLPAPVARLFRLLPLHPGPDVTAVAAAALAGLPAREGRLLMRNLEQAGLVTEHRPGRFRMHDLLRAYAAELATDESPAAVDRIATFYRDTILVGHGILEGGAKVRRPLLPDPLPVPPPGPTPLDQAGQDAAWSWFETEREILMALVRSAATDPAYGLAWLLVVGMWPYFERSGRAQDWAATASFALDAATRHQDVAGQARMNRSLAGANYYLHEYDLALRHLEQARELLGRLGLTAELARVGMNQATILADGGRHEAALDILDATIRDAEAAGDRLLAGAAMTTRAGSCVALGRLDEALEQAEHGKVEHAAVHNDWGVAHAAVVVGQVQAARGEAGGAVASWREAVAYYRKESSHALTSTVLTMIGDSLASSGDRAGAERAWREALELSDHGQTAEAQALRDRLSDDHGVGPA